MSTVRESIDVAVPVHIAYERLCHFEDYPRFMEGVHEVTQVSDDMAHWVMEVEGRTTEFNARVTELPDELVAWQSIDGPRIAEKMMFQELSADRTRIVCELELDISAYLPNDTHAEDMLDRRLKADLTGLKRYVEGADLLTMDAPNPRFDDGGILGTDTRRAGSGRATGRVTPASMPTRPSHGISGASGLGGGTGVGGGVGGAGSLKPGPRGASRNQHRGPIRGSASSISSELEDF